MKKKYLYNNQLIEEADVMDAAKQSNLDINRYIQKAGIKTVNDSYNFNGKTYTAEDILDAANQSKLGFDDYIQKAGFEDIKKKEPILSPSLDGQSPQQKDNNGEPAQSQESKFNISNDFGFGGGKIAKGQQSSSENTSSQNVKQEIQHHQNVTNIPEYNKQKEERKARIEQGTPDALKAAAKKSLKIKGLDGNNKALVNKEVGNFLVELAKGNSEVNIGKDGKVGLYQKTGAIDNLYDGMMSAINQKKDAREFAKLTDAERVEFANKKNTQAETPYEGSRPTEAGSVTKILGGAVPTVGTYIAGAAVGGLLEGAAPATGGLSTIALKPVMSFVFNEGSGANEKAMQGTLSRYAEGKKQNETLPDSKKLTDVQLMERARKGEGIDIAAGIVEAGLFSHSLPEFKAQSVTGKLLKGTAKSVLEGASKIASVEGLRGLGHGDSSSKIYSDVAKTFEENITPLAILHFATVAIGGILNTPKIIKNALKYDVVNNMSPEEVNAGLQTAVQKGEITPELAQETSNKLGEFKTALDKVPDNLSDEAKASVAGLIIKRDNLKLQAESKDESAKDLHTQEIESVNNQIKEIYRTGKPLEHEINPSTGETYKQPTFDDVQKKRVEDLAEKISKGKRIEDAEDLQAQANFPQELEKQLQRLSKEEKSANKDKEKPNTDITDNIETYQKQNAKEAEATKVEVPKPTEEAITSKENVNQESKGTTKQEEVATPENKTVAPVDKNNLVDGGIVKITKNTDNRTFAIVKSSTKWFNEINNFFNDNYGIKDVLYELQNSKEKPDESGYIKLADGTRVKEGSDKQGNKIVYIQSEKFQPKPENKTVAPVSENKNVEIDKQIQQVKDEHDKQVDKLSNQKTLSRDEWRVAARDALSKYEDASFAGWGTKSAWAGEGSILNTLAESTKIPKDIKEELMVQGSSIYNGTPIDNSRQIKKLESERDKKIADLEKNKSETVAPVLVNVDASKDLKGNAKEDWMKGKDELLAENEKGQSENVKIFNDALNSVKPDESQFYSIEVNDSGTSYTYNPSSKEFGKSVAVGDSPDGVSTFEAISPSKEKELYDGVKNGSVEVRKVPKQKYGMAGFTEQVLVKANPKHFIGKQLDRVYKSNVERAVKNDLYQDAIADGKMTPNDAKKIIESVGIEVPKDILEQAKTPTGNNVAALDEKYKQDIHKETVKNILGGKDELKLDFLGEDKADVRKVIAKRIDDKEQAKEVFIKHEKIRGKLKILNELIKKADC